MECFNSWQGIMLMLLQTSQWIVTTILEVGEARAGWGGGSVRWPHSVGGRIRTVLESPRLSPPVQAACGSSPGILPPLWFLLWPLTPPPCLSHSFIIYDRPLSSLSDACVSVLAPHVAWELVQGATISLGLTVPGPDSHGHLATVPCYWLVVTTDRSAISVRLAIWGGRLPGPIQAPSSFQRTALAMLKSGLVR